MMNMTTTQAKDYIRVGFFPCVTERASIIDLQDIFGHLPYHFVKNLFIDEDPIIRANSEKLFRIIWPKDDVDRHVSQAQTYFAKIEKIKELEQQIKKLKTDVEFYTRFIDYDWSKTE